jgi:uncharacterized protein YaiL (DUF2058 family)
MSLINSINSSISNITHSNNLTNPSLYTTTINNNNKESKLEKEHILLNSTGTLLKHVINESSGVHFPLKKGKGKKGKKKEILNPTQRLEKKRRLNREAAARARQRKARQLAEYKARVIQLEKENEELKLELQKYKVGNTFVNKHNNKDIIEKSIRNINNKLSSYQSLQPIENFSNMLDITNHTTDDSSSSGSNSSDDYNDDNLYPSLSNNLSFNYSDDIAMIYSDETFNPAD